MWGGSFQLCRALIIYKCAARRSWIRTWSWIFTQTWAQALEQRTEMFLMMIRPGAALCVYVWRCDEETSPAAALVLLVLLIKEESSALKMESHHIQQLPRLLVDCGRNFSRDKLKSPVRRWPLMVAVIMTTAKKEVRWGRIQRECVQVSWRPSARYSNSYITSLHQDESALTSVRWNDWSVEDLRSARWHNGFRSSLAVRQSVRGLYPESSPSYRPHHSVSCVI